MRSAGFRMFVCLLGWLTLLEGVSTANAAVDEQTAGQMRAGAAKVVITPDASH